jgi:ketosteroid isomerase-like protein
MSELKVDQIDYTIKLAYRESQPNEDAERNRENLLVAFDCLVKGDKEPFWALFDPDMSFHEADCLPYGGSHYGLAVSQKAHGQVYELFDQIHIDLEQVMAAGDVAIAYCTMRYRVRKNGRTGEFTLAEVYRFRAGKVIEWRIHYFDAAKVAEAISAE